MTYMKPSPFIIEKVEVMDIQEKDKNRSQIDKTEHENRKSVKEKVKNQQKAKVKSSQSQPQEVDLERASKTKPENLNCQKWAHPYPPNKDLMDKIIELGDYSKWRATIDLRPLSHKKHRLEPSQQRSTGSLSLDKVIELGDYSKWRATIDLRPLSHKKHRLEPSQQRSTGPRTFLRLV
ncbi:hypothetical protein Tco_0708335 [Tanacetum coccineum]